MTPEEIAALAKAVAEQMASAAAPVAPVARPSFDNQYVAPPAQVDPAAIAKTVAEMLAPQFKPQPDVAALIKEAFAARDAEAQRQSLLASVPAELHQIMPSDNAKLSEFLTSEVYTKLAAPFQAAPVTSNAPVATTEEGQPAAPTGNVSTTPTEEINSGAQYEEQRSELFKSFAGIFEDA